jgi:hypothetical protein
MKMENGSWETGTACGKRLSSWTAVALHRFCHRIATTLPSSKAPAAVAPKRRFGAPRRRKGWRSPKPGGGSFVPFGFGTKIRVHPRIAAWPPRGFTPCSAVVDAFCRRIDFMKMENGSWEMAGTSRRDVRTDGWASRSRQTTASFLWQWNVLQLSVGRASSRAGLGAPKRSGGGSSVASPHQTVPLPIFCWLC